MTYGLDTDAKKKKKRHANPFWHQKEYKKSAKLLGFSFGKLIGNAIKHGKRKRK